MTWRMDEWIGWWWFKKHLLKYLSPVAKKKNINSGYCTSHQFVHDNLWTVLYSVLLTINVHGNIHWSFCKDNLSFYFSSRKRAIKTIIPNAFEKNSLWMKLNEDTHTRSRINFYIDAQFKRLIVNTRMN